MCPRLACFRLQDSGENELRKSLRARVLFTLLARFFRSSTLTESLAHARPWSVPKTNSARDSALYFQMWCKTYKRLVYRLQPSRHTNVCKISRLCKFAIFKALFPAMSMDTGSLAFISLNKWPAPKRYVSLWINEPQMSFRPQLQQVRHPLRACWSIGIKLVVFQKRY